MSSAGNQLTCAVESSNLLTSGGEALVSKGQGPRRVPALQVRVLPAPPAPLPLRTGVSFRLPPLGDVKDELDYLIKKDDD